MTSEPMPTAPETPVLYRTVLRPHRSLNRGSLRLVVGLVAGALGVSSFGFLLAGAWPVVGFLGLEVVALYAALRFFHRGADIEEEVILVTEREVTVRRTDGRGRRRSWSFPPHWLRVDPPQGHPCSGPVTLRSHGRSVAIGGFLPPRQRHDLVANLRQVLAPLSGLPEMAAARPRRAPCSPCAPAAV